MKLTAKEMLNKFSNKPLHAQEVQRIAAMIFEEASKNIFEMSSDEKKYLDAAALLHDIGYAVNAKSHNKHSMRIVIENGLDGFSETEEKIVACICRYHRGSLPDKVEHEIYNTLDKKDRKIVKRLGGIVKLADGLDTERLIKDIKINFDEQNKIAEIIITPDSLTPELASAIRKRDLFEIGFKCQSVLKFSQ